jgi:chromate transporter
MKDGSDTLISLAGYFAMLSLFAIGGANAAVPEMHRLVVDVKHWLTDAQFTHLFAIAQVTPGPNVIIVTLIGFQVAGIAGALVTTLGMVGPTCVFAYGVGKIWDRFRDAPWRKAIQSGLVPISIGLVAASGLIIARAAAVSWAAAGIIAVTAVVSYTTRLNPLWMFGLAALIGLADWL